MTKKKSSKRQSKSNSPAKTNTNEIQNNGSDETDFKFHPESYTDDNYILRDRVPIDIKSYSRSEELESSEVNLEAENLTDTESDRIENLIKKASEIKSQGSTINTQKKQKFINFSNIRSTKFWMIIFAIPVTLQCLFSHVLSNNDNSVAEYHLNISEKLNKLAAKYNQDEDTWMLFEAGITRAINEYSENHNGEIAVFFLTQWSNQKKNTAFEISKDIGEIVTKYMSQSNKTQATILTPNTLNDLNRGEIISKFSANLTSSHVLILPEIEQISSFIAQDLRYICDEENPVIPKLIVFLIMNVKDCKDIERNHFNIKQKCELINIVEDCITEIWGGADGLRPEVLKPLLARIINTVIVVK